jgi:hypothetical protein
LGLVPPEALFRKSVKKGREGISPVFVMSPDWNMGVIQFFILARMPEQSHAGESPYRLNEPDHGINSL